MPVYKFIIQSLNHNPKSTYYLNEAHVFGFHALRKIIVQDLYFIEGQLSQEDLQIVRFIYYFILLHNRSKFISIQDQTILKDCKV